MTTPQRDGIGDSSSFQQVMHGERFELLERWREISGRGLRRRVVWRRAERVQMLTPAPDLTAVAWKRGKLRSEHWEYCDVKPERLQSIDADVEWLAAHPTRKSTNALKGKQ
jgi:hypothetical protein